MMTTSKQSGADTSVTEALCLESSSEEDLSEVTDLVLRGLGLASMDAMVSAKLATSLLSLSLSHNSFTELTNFEALGMLTDLNLNFNNLTASCVGPLSHLQNLRRLYMSNNSLSDDGLALISKSNSFRQLELLVLFKNGITNIQATQAAVAELPSLIDLELGGNRICGDPGYRHAIIRAGRKLKVLDGEEITELDVELAVEAVSAPRPSAVPKLKLRGIESSNVGSDAGDARSFGGFGDDPILLTYRASAVLEVSAVEDADSAEKIDGKADIEKLAGELGKTSGKRGGLVGRLRGTSVSKGNKKSAAAPDENTDNRNIAAAAGLLGINASDFEDDEDDRVDMRNETEQATKLNTQDPWSIVRKLLLKCEHLTDENTKLRRHQLIGAGGLADAAEMQRELERLRIENASMYLLVEENRSLKKENEGLTLENQELRMNKAKGRDVIPVLDLEKASAWEASLPAYPEVGIPTPRSSCQGSSRQSSSRASGSRPSSSRSRPSSSRPSSGRATSDTGTLYDDLGLQRPGTAGERIESGYLEKLREEAGLVRENPNDEDIWDDDEEEDAEIFDLIERNEAGLAKIRDDLAAANKEYVEFEKKAMAETANEVLQSTSGKTLSITELLALRKKIAS